MQIDKVLSGKKIDVELTEEDVEVLAKYVKDIEPPNCYLEIGTKCGGSALVAKEVNKNIEVYTIDGTDVYYLPHKKELEDIGIKFIKSMSVEAARTWTKPIGVLFIDGDHDQAQQDFGAWEKFVVPGGIILFHDYNGRHSPKVIEDCRAGVLRDDNFERLFVPTDNDETSILQIKKL